MPHTSDSAGPRVCAASYIPVLSCFAQFAVSPASDGTLSKPSRASLEHSQVLSVCVNFTNPNHSITWNSALSSF